MAEIVQLLTVKINGTDKALNTVEDLVDAQQQLNAEMAKVDKGSRAYVNLNKELTKVDAKLEEVAKSGAKASSATADIGSKGGGAFGKLDGALKKGITGFGVLRTAIAATGIGLLVQLVIQVISYFQRFSVVLDFVENATAAVGAAIGSLVDAFGKLLQGDFEGALKGATTGLVENAKAAVDAENSIRAAGDAVRDYAAEEQRLGAEIDKRLRQSRDVTRSEEERLKLIQEAGQIEQELTATQLKNAQELLEANEKKFASEGNILPLYDKLIAARRALTDAELSGNEQAIAASRAKTQALEAEFLAAGNNAQLEDEIAGLRAGLEGQRRAASNLGEKLLLRENALREQIAQEEEKRAQDAEARRIKRLDDELKAFEAEQTLALARIALRTDDEAAIQRAETNRATELERIRVRVAKGEQVSRQERLTLEQNFQNELDKIGAAAAKRQADREKADAQRQAALVERARAASAEIAKLSEEDLRRLAQDPTQTLGARIALENQLADVTIARLTAERDLRLANDALLQDERDAINATYDAQITGIERTTAATQRGLQELGSPVLTALFGDLTAEETSKVQANLQSIAATALETGRMLFDAYLEGIRQNAEEAARVAEEAEARSQEAAQRSADLRANLLTADLSQRAGIIKAIQAEDAARRKADAEASKARGIERAERRRAAQTQRAADVAQAVVNTAQAVIRAFADGGPIIGPVLAGIAAAVGAAQIGIITSQPLPQFAAGGFTGPGAGGADSTGQRTAGVVHAGEYVVPASVLSRPAASPLVSALEGMRQGGNGYASGGFAEPGASGGSQATDMSQVVEAIRQMPAPVVSVVEIEQVGRPLVSVRERTRL